MSQVHSGGYFLFFLRNVMTSGIQYEKLKLLLWKSYEHDRDGYTNAKYEFVSEHTQRAKEKYKDRYL